MAIKLSSIDQFEQVLKDNKYVFVLKHSDTCQSQQMHTIDLINFYMKEIWMAVLSRSRRKLSDYIAEKTNVKHESPQAFYFIDGEATWNASHSDINVSSLAQAEE